MYRVVKTPNSFGETQYNKQVKYTLGVKSVFYMRNATSFLIKFLEALVLLG
jgi:hypothetical protein